MEHPGFATMWNKCELGGKEYLIKHTVNEAQHKIHITDLICLWHEEISEPGLLQRCKEMNKLLEADDDVLLDLVWSLVDGKREEDVITSLVDHNTSKQLNLQCSLDGLKFRIKFVLHQVEQSQFFKEVTCPLLVSIVELEKRQGLLLDVIKKKDLEIAEYKLEGAKISRKAVETQVFDPENFFRKCTEDVGTSKGVVEDRSSSAFTPLIQGLLSEIRTAHAIPPKGNQEMLEEDVGTNRKLGPIKLKSPVKAKKSKLYEDEEDETSDKEKFKKEDNNVFLGGLEQKEQKYKPPLKKVKPKVKKALSNL